MCFECLAHARRIIAAWREDYNNVRPHGSIGNMPPAVFRAQPAPTLAVAQAAHLWTGQFMTILTQGLLNQTAPKMGRASVSSHALTSESASRLRFIRECRRSSDDDAPVKSGCSVNLKNLKNLFVGSQAAMDIDVINLSENEHFRECFGNSRRLENSNLAKSSRKSP